MNQGRPSDSASSVTHPTVVNRTVAIRGDRFLKSCAARVSTRTPVVRELETCSHGEVRPLDNRLHTGDCLPGLDAGHNFDCLIPSLTTSGLRGDYLLARLFRLSSFCACSLQKRSLSNERLLTHPCREPEPRATLGSDSSLLRVTGSSPCAVVSNAGPCGSVPRV